MPRIAIGTATPSVKVPQGPPFDTPPGLQEDEGPTSLSVSESGDLDWSTGKFPTSVSVDEQGEITWQ
jgi:hypothetical protein